MPLVEGSALSQGASPCDSLAGGPAHLTSSQQVDVKVVDRLTAVGAVVDDDAVASVGDTELHGDFTRGHQQTTQQLFVCVL